jgi:hypothetical protein
VVDGSVIKGDNEPMLVYEQQENKKIASEEG